MVKCNYEITKNLNDNGNLLSRLRIIFNEIPNRIRFSRTSRSWVSFFSEKTRDADCFVGIFSTLLFRLLFNFQAFTKIRLLIPRLLVFATEK